MAGLPASSSSTSHDIVEIIKVIQRVGCCLDLSVQNYEISEKKLRSYFTRVLAVFRSEIEQPKNIRPDQVLLGDGRAVDLSKLYFAVHEKGCYESVTVDKGWGSVSATLGFRPSLGYSLKLVYAKYLYGVEKWFRKLLVNNEAAKEVHGLVVEVNGLDLAEDEAKGTPAIGTLVSDAKKSHFLTPCRDMKRRLEIDHNKKGGKDVMISETKMGEQSYSKKRKRDDEQGGKDVMAIETKSSIKKRKRDDLDEMVGWLKNLAKSPLIFCDDKMSSEGGKDNGRHMVGRFHYQLLWARELRLCKRIQLMNGITENLILQKHQKFHPSMYDDDDMDFDTSEKLRQSERLQSGNKQLYPSSRSQSPSVPPNGIYNPVDKPRKSNPLLDIMANLQQKEYKYQPLPISSKFQAKLPQLVDKSSYADDTYSSKWLGTQIWPQENKKLEQFKPHHPIGKGRVNNCKCKNHGSIECTRFHIAEKRHKLKSELGTAFYQWSFNHMGEEVALSWTEEESKKFKDVVQSYVTSPDRDLWKQLRLAFPLKKKKELVSYYFNVFTLSRRRYQNRVTPIEINSDDDEEFGFLSVPFGEDAMEGYELKANVCVQNTQCAYFDDVWY